MLRGKTPCMSATVETMRGTRSSCSVEDFFRDEGAIVGLCPKVCTGNGVDQLHGNAQPGSSLPQTSFHDIAGAEFFPDRAHIHGLVGIATGGTERDDTQIREAGKSGDDFLRHSVCQGGEIGVATAVLKWQHRDPEALVGSNRSRVRARLWSVCFCRASPCSLWRAGRFIVLGNREPCFAQAFEDGIHQAAREVPGSDVRARVRRKLGIERQQIPDCGRGFDAPAEVPAGRRHDEDTAKRVPGRPPGSRTRGPARTRPCGSDPRAERNASSRHDWDSAPSLA